MEKKKLIKIFANINITLGIIAIVFAIITVLFIGFPQLFQIFNLSSPEAEIATLTQSIDKDFERYKPKKIAHEETKEVIIEPEIEKKTLPPINFSLPNRQILNIPKIEVDGIILEGEDFNTLLEQGIWRVHDFGTPEDETVMILASHRFGYITWTSEHRNKNSFYHLPKTGVGDRIEIVWNQKLYLYEIYKTEESTEITDYTADLILYTCKLYNSPIRIFRYANRIN
jgi:LPXTG-site transpeptidase (sortase) family protein